MDVNLIQLVLTLLGALGHLRSWDSCGQSCQGSSVSRHCNDICLSRVREWNDHLRRVSSTYRHSVIQQPTCVVYVGTVVVVTIVETGTGAAMVDVVETVVEAGITLVVVL